MKIRKGFVSNSSSSSFVCDVCAEAESGWDIGLEDADMFQCENGHTFCRDHTVGGREAVEVKREADENFDYYEVPAEYCPCCHFYAVSDVDIITYFMKEKGMIRDDVAKMFKEKFPTYEDFKKYVRGVKQVLDDILF